MDFRIISLPPFTAATSGPSPAFDFSPEGVLGKFNAYFSSIKPSPRDSLLSGLYPDFITLVER